VPWFGTAGSGLATTFCLTAYCSYVRRLRGGEATVRTLGRAKELALAGAVDDVAIAELRRVAGSNEVLVECAELFEDRTGFPATTMVRWCRAASGEEFVPVCENQGAEEAEQRALFAMPLDEAFRLLAERLPRLAELESEARDPARVRLHGRWRLLVRVSHHEQSRQLAALAELVKRSRLLVGPNSSNSDPLLNSPAAEAVVQRHLAQLLGVLGDHS
jgi:hypothetical protein